MSFNEKNYTEWSNVILGDICTIKGGKRLPKGKQLSSNKTKHPYIKVKDMRENKYISLNSGFEYLDDETFKSISRYIVNENDLIISIVGTIGLIGLIDKSLESANLTENCVKLIDIKYVTNDFLYYYLKSPLGEHEIKKGVVCSTQPKLPIYNIQKIALSYPPIPEQKAIAKILSDLDEKIEINNKINKTLEEMAQAIFKQWFVDFEFPNENGKPYKSSGGEMVESELGMIPKGWKVIKLHEIGNLTMGLSPKSKSYNTIGEGTPLLNGAADFNDDLIKPQKYTTQETRVCRKNDLVFCIRATIGNITFADREYCLGRGVAAVEPKNNLYVGLIYMNLLKSMEKLKAQATGSVILGLSKSDINDMKLILPNNDIVDNFSNIFNKVFDKKFILQLENDNLIKLRDTLLPKLMSGEIIVPLD